MNMATKSLKPGVIADWWWTRNDDGFWCNACGDCIKPSFHFDSEDDADDFEPGACRNCGAPDEIDHEAI